MKVQNLGKTSKRAFEDDNVLHVEKKNSQKYQTTLAYIFIMCTSKINVTEIFQNKIFILTGEQGNINGS